LENPHVIAIFGRKVQSKSATIAVFRKFKGLHIKYSNRDPQQTLPYPARRLLRILRKNPFKVVGCSLIVAPIPKKEETNNPIGTAKSRIWGA